MRLFFICKNCQRKVYLNTDAKSRKQLASEWGKTFPIQCGECEIKNLVNVNEVFAEPSIDSPLSTPVSGSIIAGALIGSTVPGLGTVFGGLIGGVIGRIWIDNSVKIDEAQVAQFNNSDLK